MSIHLAEMARQPETGVITMSDDNTNEQATDAPDVSTDSAQSELEKLRAEADKWKSLSRKNEDRARENAEAAKAWAEHQEASKSEEEQRAAELEQLRTRAADLEKALADKDRMVLAQQVAASKGVPAKYLTGDTEEDLVASADELLEAFKGVTPERKPGVVPTAGTGDPKPQAASLDTGAERARALLGK
jgi:hypothetical protein